MMQKTIMEKSECESVIIHRQQTVRFFSFTTEPLAYSEVRPLLVNFFHCGRSGAFRLDRGRLLGRGRCCLLFLVNVETKSENRSGNFQS